ncbi:hypothetical protein E2R62_15455 [Citrobacter rodentium]|uniref:Uncharacterized protein n=1 Tax=Citrobacter rodentium TaxID=67825 RepID=A0A482PR50_CITRO|nr:hypothetical protein E2R62_15455 [Citrobacter rodentium]HAT8015194.1 hypothetical protein [Citrobacter rodentium NBRC 105723 = DSM 16636]HAT8020081.1 hypothetical protein [Citrobacter rodentium]HAT8029812.1 hypothetical protein [Citrobacter rodentium]HAT8034848.1 hypothetical protein [Citrobacter rodentium]
MPPASRFFRVCPSAAVLSRAKSFFLVSPCPHCDVKRGKTLKLNVGWRPCLIRPATTVLA